jgi:hypothetical protein
MHHVKICPMLEKYLKSYGAILNTNKITENKRM